MISKVLQFPGKVCFHQVTPSSPVPAPTGPRSFALGISSAPHEKLPISPFSFASTGPLPKPAWPRIGDIWPSQQWKRQNPQTLTGWGCGLVRKAPAPRKPDCEGALPSWHPSPNPSGWYAVASGSSWTFLLQKTREPGWQGHRPLRARHESRSWVRKGKTSVVAALGFRTVS